jgi:hypothetical protein
MGGVDDSRDNGDHGDAGTEAGCEYDRANPQMKSRPSIREEYSFPSTLGLKDGKNGCGHLEKACGGPRQGHQCRTEDEQRVANAGDV